MRSSVAYPWAAALALSLPKLLQKTIRTGTVTTATRIRWYDQKRHSVLHRRLPPIVPTKETLKSDPRTRDGKRKNGKETILTMNRERSRPTFTRTSPGVSMTIGVISGDLCFRDLVNDRGRQQVRAIVVSYL
jgi:hypothetical protein